MRQTQRRYWNLWYGTISGDRFGLFGTLFIFSRSSAVVTAGPPEQVHPKVIINLFKMMTTTTIMSQVRLIGGNLQDICCVCVFKSWFLARDFYYYIRCRNFDFYQIWKPFFKNKNEGKYFYKNMLYLCLPILLK